MKIVPIFHHDDGRNLVPTARHIWDALMEDRPDVEQVGTKSGPEIEEVFRLRAEAERFGEDASTTSTHAINSDSSGNRRKAITPSRCDGEALVGSACPKCDSIA